MAKPYGEDLDDSAGEVRLRLHHAEMQRDAFQKSLNTEVLKIVRVAIIQATIDADEEVARLKGEVEQLKKPAVIGGYNISEYIRMANSETLEFDNGDVFADMTLPERIKYIVESHGKLKAELSNLNYHIRKTFMNAKAQIDMADENKRLKAEIRSLESSHIHTCSKGCRKPGCSRALRDTIEEQDLQIEGLKRDLLEKAAELRALKTRRGESS